MEYNREDLEKKKLPELKQILKNLNAKTTGNKSNLIKRILQLQTTYFDILPRDVANIVGEYQAFNNPNNQFLNLLIKLLLWNSPDLQYRKNNSIPEDIKTYLSFRGLYDHTSNFKKLNDFFIPLNIEFIPNKQYSSKFDNIEVGKIPFVDDKLMIEVLIVFLKSGLIYYDTLNKLLYYEEMPFAIVNLGDVYNYEYLIIYGGEKILSSNENWYEK